MSPFSTLSVLPVLCLLACDSRPLPVSPIKVEPEPAPATSAVEATPEPDLAYAYSPIGRKDPFRAALIDERGDTAEGPLQKFELEQLKLIAVATGMAAPYAMVEDPEGVGHVVRRGDLIGKHWGRVQTVLARALVIREERITLKQGKTVELTRLEMPEPKLPYSLARAY